MSTAIHALMLAALCVVVAPRPIPQPPPPPSFAVVMSAPPAPAVEQSLEEAKMPVAIQTMAAQLAAPMPLSLAPSLNGEIHAPRRRLRTVAAPPQPQAAPAPRMAAAPPASPAQAPAAHVPHDALLGLEARIRQAVQDAAIYPESARAMHLEGRTQVRFDYTDGSVGAEGVATSSDSPMLDRAALAAVRRAALPRAPAEIGARTLPLLVWVDFQLVRQD
jgi:protein TonB